MNTRLPLVVRRGSSLTLPLQVTSAPAAPTIFTSGNSGTGQGMILAGSVLADAAHPVSAGDSVVIQCTGLGAVNPSATAGSAAPDSPAAAATATIAVSIGSADAQVTSAVLQSGMTGVYQVSAVVPSGVSGGAAPVYLTVSGQKIPVVTMAVE
jgi:uncharacterized protein (TIGR03437 family)